MHQGRAPLNATHDTKEDANAYAVAMAKKWIDDRGTEEGEPYRIGFVGSS